MKSSVRQSERLPKVHLYEDPSSKTLDLQKIALYLREKFGEISVDTRAPLVTATHETAETLARRLVDARILDLTGPSTKIEPLLGEIDFEMKLILEPTRRFTGTLYDGFRLQALARELLLAEELNIEHAHIVFTNRLFGTWEAGDGRYHARVSVYGFPSLISTTGIVEAPAKPKQYYLLKQRYAALGATVPLEEIKEKFRGRFIDYDDERMTNVMKGYVMQALFYHISGEPFCDKVTCRLHNSHWHEEVIKSQLEPRESEFCDYHDEMLKKFRSVFGGRV